MSDLTDAERAALLSVDTERDAIGVVEGIVAARERAAAALALRDAAEVARSELDNEIGSGYTSTYFVRRWLRDRADAVDAAPSQPEQEDQPEPKSYFCEKCGHPHDYHNTERGCSMPLDRKGLPIMRNDAYVRTCECKGEGQP